MFKSNFMRNIKILTILIVEYLNNGPNVWGKRDASFKLEINPNLSARLWSFIKEDIVCISCKLGK